MAKNRKLDYELIPKNCTEYKLRLEDFIPFVGKKKYKERCKLENFLLSSGIEEQDIPCGFSKKDVLKEHYLNWLERDILLDFYNTSIFIGACMGAYKGLVALFAK